jgi:hypothetical protein
MVVSGDGVADCLDDDENISTIIFEKNITEIPKQCCRYWHGLVRVVISETVSRIGEQAF